MIQNKLINFKTRAQFDAKLKAGEVSAKSVVFIESTGEIWTHNRFYGGLNQTDGVYLPITGGTLTGNLTAPKYLSVASGKSIEMFAASTYGKIQTRGNIPLLINPEGNSVAIGKTSATEMLDVNGNILAANFKKSGSNNSYVLLGGGSHHSLSDLQAPYEANLRWGGRNFSGDYGCIDAAMIPFLGANRLAFMPSNAITVEYSRDLGSTWIDYGADNAQKESLFSGSSNAALVIGKADSSNKDNGKFRLRITINTGVGNVYTQLNKFCIYVSTNGSQGVTCTIDAALESDPTNFSKVVSNNTPISGWSGYNILNVSPFTTYGNTTTNQYGRVRFTFASTGGSTTYNGLNVRNIFGFGGVGWVTPSNMARWGQIYSFDSSQGATFPAMLKSIGSLYEGNNRVYSAGNTNIGVAASNYAAGNQPITAISTTTTTATFTRGAGNLTLTYPTFNQNTTGNAATATKLTNKRKINNVDFDGTANIETTQMYRTLLVNNTNLDTIITGGWYVANGSVVVETFTNCPTKTTFSMLVAPNSASRLSQTIYDYNGNSWFRYFQGTAWTTWKNILDSTNYTSYTVKKDGTGATGTWGISISGTAAIATKIAVHQHTTNNTNYPLVWTNQTGTTSVTDNQLYKSSGNLYYNPSTKSLTATTFIGNLTGNVSGSSGSCTGNAATVTNGVYTNNAQTISGKKTFSVQQEFTVAQGTAPFAVVSNTKVANLNADLLDGYDSSNFWRKGELEIGDRNLIINSTIPVSNPTSYLLGNYYFGTFIPIHNETYTLIIKSNLNGRTAFRPHNIGGNSAICDDITDKDKKGDLYIKTFIWNWSSAATNKTGISLYASGSGYPAVNVEWIKLVKGNATSLIWTPAPEDKLNTSDFTWTNLPGKPTWIGATKPSYAFSEITGTAVISQVSGLQGALDGKLSTTGKAADSDKLNGKTATSYIRNEQSTSTSTTNIDANNIEYNSFKHDYRWDNTAYSHISSIMDLTYSNDWRTQLQFRHNKTPEVSIRSRYNGTTWTDWGNLWTSFNFNPSLKANLASPTFTGTPTAPTAAAKTNTTQIATTAFVRKEVSDLVGGAPETLDTLKEIADYLTNGSIAGSIVDQLGKKVNKAGDTMTDSLIIKKGRSFDPAAIGFDIGNLHLVNNSSNNDYISSITFSGQPNSASQAQAGIYVQGSGSYGTKMYFATTSSHAQGPNKVMMLDHLGVLKLNNNIVWHAGNLTGNQTGHTHNQYYDSNVDRTKNTILAAPATANGKATFRSLVAADLPIHTHNYLPHIQGTSAISCYVQSTLDWNGIKITLPTTYSPNTSSMLSFTIRLYTSYNYTDIVCSGYVYGDNKWHSPACEIIGGTKSYRVIMGWDAINNGKGNLYVWVGNNKGEKLSYGGMAVMNVLSGHVSNNVVDGWIVENKTLTECTTNAQLDKIPSLTAKLNSNVASATKLETTRTIWGQSFDGSANISGNLTNVGNINSINNILFIKTSGVEVAFETGAGETRGIVLNNYSFKPYGAANNKLDLGSNDAKWKNVHATSFIGNVTGNVSGSAGSCTGNSSTATKLLITDNRGADRAPNYYSSNSLSTFFNHSIPNYNAWASGITVRGWSDGYAVWQLFGYSSVGASDELYFRSSKTDTTWETARRIWHSGNSGTTSLDWSAKSLTLAGGISGATALASSGELDINSVSHLRLRAGSRNIIFNATSNHFKPYDSDNNIIDLGLSTARWKTIYGTALNLNGAISGATTISASGAITASNVWNIITIEKTLTVTEEWMDTGIVFDSTTIPSGSGSYIISAYENAYSVGGSYFTTYTGMCSIYAGNTNQSDYSEEISLHANGHAISAKRIYLRTMLVAGNKGGKLQIATSEAWTGASNITFKFKRLM